MALFSSTQPSLRARVLPRFPANVVAGAGITISKSGGRYTFSVTPTDTQLNKAITYNGGLPPTATTSWIYQDGASITGTLGVPVAGSFASPISFQFNDSVDATAASYLYGLNVTQYLVAGHGAGRATIAGQMFIVDPTTLPGNYTGALGLVGCAVNLGGITGALSNYKGALFGGNSNVFATASATFMQLMSAHEFDMQLETGGSVGRKLGIMVVLGPSDAVRGTYEDSAIQIANAGGTAGKWLNGISFGDYSVEWPFAADSTLINANASILNPIPIVALNGVDFSNVTFSGSAFKSVGFSVDAVGSVVATTGIFDFVANATTVTTLVNGLNSDIAPTGSRGRISGPTLAFSVGGFAPIKFGIHFNGERFYLYNPTGKQMTIVNEDLSSTAANRIKTLTGSDVVLRAGSSFATFSYDGSDGRWILESSN